MNELIVDLSNNNGPGIDFARLRDEGHVTGVYLKASEGAHFVDPYGVDFATRARKAGLRVGSYHFARPDQQIGDAGATVEADHFVACLKKIGVADADFRPCLDFETAGPGLEQWARTFCARVKATGPLALVPLLYSYPWFLGQVNAKTPIGAALWLASYGRNDGKEYPYKIPAPWKNVHLHQFTSEARLPGVSGNCDLSIAPKGLTALLARPKAGA
jgi:lysozyme